MALAPGTRLGPYEVTSQLGAGGMGEVYRAHHAALKREVAIKINTLPSFSSGTPQPFFRVRGRPEISNTDRFSYDVTKDGTRFIVNTFVRPASVPPLEIVLNATASQR